MRLQTLPQYQARLATLMDRSSMSLEMWHHARRLTKIISQLSGKSFDEIWNSYL